MEKERLEKLMNVLSENHWTFKGYVTANELPVRGNDYFREKYGDKYLKFRRVYAFAKRADDFFARDYTEMFISLESDKLNEELDSPCYAVIKHSWFIPGDDCKWDKDCHITNSGTHGTSGCLCEGAERFDSERSFNYVADKHYCDVVYFD